MATTTNYGWTTPDDTALVKDGASAIRSLGSAIDSTVYSKLGLVHINTTNFSGVTSQSVNSVFTSTYDDYKVLITCSTFASDTDFWVKFRASGTDSSASYNWANNMKDTANADVTAVGTAGTNGIFLGRSDAGTSNSYAFEFTLSGIFAAAPTTLIGNTLGRSSAGVLQGGTLAGNHTASTSYDGLTVLTSSGNVAGTIKIYGMKK